jgi:hypothetical protein
VRFVDCLDNPRKGPGERLRESARDKPFAIGRPLLKSVLNKMTLADINKATKQNAWSYKTNGTYLAKRYGGTFGTNDNTGAERRFRIK